MSSFYYLCTIGCPWIVCLKLSNLYGYILSGIKRLLLSWQWKAKGVITVLWRTRLNKFNIDKCVFVQCLHKVNELVSQVKDHKHSLTCPSDHFH